MGRKPSYSNIIYMGVRQRYHRSKSKSKSILGYLFDGYFKFLGVIFDIQPKNNSYTVRHLKVLGYRTRLSAHGTISEFLRALVLN